MSRSTTYLNPALGLAPGCVSLAMVALLLRCLPPPRPGGAVALDRQMIQDALAMVDAIGPRDVLEAKLAIHMAALESEAMEMLALARAETELPERMRVQRHAAMLDRRREALGREIRRHRRELAAMDEVHVSPPAWDYDLDALEATWRDPTATLPAAARRERALEIPAGLFGSAPVAPVVVSEAPEPAEMDAAEGWDDAPPARRVPLWKINGRRFMDESSSEELKEMTDAATRGEPIEEPPVRPDGMRVRRHPDAELVLTQAQIDALTLEERRARYGI